VQLTSGGIDGNPGLSLKDMGIMGRINLTIGAAWDRWFLLGGERQSAVSSPPNYDVSFYTC